MIETCKGVDNNIVTRLRQIFVCLVMLAFCQRSLATSIFVYIGRDAIYVGSDSLFKDPQAGISLHYCKIHNSGKFYWAAATVSYLHRTTGFDLEKLVESVGTEGTVDSIMERFIASAYRPLSREVESLETEDPARYKDIIAPDGQRPLEIVFLVLENGKPSLAITDFIACRVKNHIVIKPHRRKLETDDLTGVGDWEPAAQYFDNHPSLFRLDPKEAIMASLQAVAEGNPDVGAPFSVLRLGSVGPEWLEPSLCK